MKKISPFVVLTVSIALLSVQWLWPADADPHQPRQYSELINLALRQTGHELLSHNGDSTSTLFPIRVISENEYSLQIQQVFNYDTLPYVLDAALSDYGILSTYHVVVKNCETDTVLLGYNQLAFENKKVACMGREQWSDCNNINVVFDYEPQVEHSNLFTNVVGLLGLLLFVGLIVSTKMEKAEPLQSGSKNNPKHLMGHTEFDFPNQHIHVNGESKTLTFRENKLLQFFAAHPNKILEREKILSEVWGDEGVIVGRSLDVFVSRLRKILKGDESLNIKNVHGVGYKFEVKASQ